MAQEANVPASFKQQIEKLIDDKISQFARSGFLRNASITGGAGLKIGAGGKIVVEHPSGRWLMLMGTYDGPSNSFDMPDGSKQPMALIYRADGSIALGMFDPDPSNGFQQFLAMFDRNNNIIMSDDTDSGQGLARPYIPICFYPAIFGGRTITTSNAWTTLWRATVYKQHPRLLVGAGALMDTAGTTGQIRVLVNGAQLGAVQAVTSTAAAYSWGPLPVPGEHVSTLTVEIQAQRTSASGGLEAVANYGYGLQS